MSPPPFSSESKQQADLKACLLEFRKHNPLNKGY